MEDEGTLPWVVVGATATGTEHVKRGWGNDDAFAFRVEPGRGLVACVADGAGSVTGTSAWGSYLACRGLLEQTRSADVWAMVEHGDPEQVLTLGRTLASAALSRVAAVAEILGLPLRRLATTLSFVLCGEHRCLAGQVGDGIIVLRRPDGMAWVLAEEKTGYANESVFLNSEETIEAELRVATFDGVDAIGLSTDGLRYKICNLAAGTPYEPFFERLWSDIQHKGISGKTLSSALAQIPNDQTGDDKTLVVAVRAAGRVTGDTSRSPDLPLLDGSPGVTGCVHADGGLPGDL